MHVKICIATRKSALAIAQTTLAAEKILEANRAPFAGESLAGRSCLEYELVGMTTEGDRRLDKSLASFGGKGVFIKELEVALLENRADIAIHSLKDMPSELLPEFRLAAVLKREDPRDAFLARGGANGDHFMDLPAGAKVGTGSIRRIVQLKELRPDLEYVSIRGNIQTRISKLSELDGIVLAAAGLNRMGLADKITECFDIEKVLPASGQGILAIETLKDEAQACLNASAGDSELSMEHRKKMIGDMLNRVNDVETYCVAVAEMAYLKALDAGCQFPVASFAEFRGAKLHVRGIYYHEQSGILLKESVEDFCPDCVCARDLGIALAEKIKMRIGSLN